MFFIRCSSAITQKKYYEFVEKANTLIVESRKE